MMSCSTRPRPSSAPCVGCERNTQAMIAVHDYQRLEIEVVGSIIHERLDDLAAYAGLLIQLARG